jgi:hypothetical protein
MLLEVALASLLLGVALTFAVQFLILRMYLSHTPVQQPKNRDQYPEITLPQV